MELKEKIKSAPKYPGCYIYKDDKDQVIYVGMSKFLPKRVSSYFTKKHDDKKTKTLVEQIRDVEYQIASSEAEALIMEEELIKIYKPKFNIKGKDDKSRTWYLSLTEGPYSKLQITHGKGDEPHGINFTSGLLVNEVMQLINDILPLRTCSYTLNQENISAGKFKPCLEYHLGRCNAPCVSNILKFSYKKIISEMKELFSFEFDKVRSRLKKSMKYFSDSMEFEKAQDMKNRMSVVDDLQNKLETFRIRRYNDIAREFKESLGLINVPTLIEAFDNSHTAGDCQVSALVRYKNGKTDKSNYRKFNIKSVEGPDDYASFTEVLNRRFKRLLDEKQELPSLVVIDGGKGQLGVAKQVFESLGLLSRIDLISISKNDKHQSQTIHLIDGSSFDIPRNEFGFLLAEVQNEVHRFVISFHRQKRSKKVIG